jgi:hypothetical protein
LTRTKRETSTGSVPGTIGIEIMTPLTTPEASLARSPEGFDLQIAAASPAVAVRNHQAILQCTTEVFPGAKIDVEEAADPEIEGDEYLVVLVTTRGEARDIAARHREWHRRVRAVAPQTAGSYRLLLDVQ